jgi:Asp-tRNA(Asn)/Glu-tRNA(Gln) amidotransferase A subunit family amidase
VPLPPSATADLRGLRIAVTTGEGAWQAAPHVADAVRRAGAAIVAAGGVEVAWEFEWLAPAWDITKRYWARAGWQPELTGADVMRELEGWDRYVHRYRTAIADIDLIVAPATADTAPLRTEVIDGESFIHLLPASLVGAPALSLPVGTDAGGLPIGVQIVGRPWADHIVLAAGRAVESAA